MASLPVVHPVVPDCPLVNLAPLPQSHWLADGDHESAVMPIEPAITPAPQRGNSYAKHPSHDIQCPAFVVHFSSLNLSTHHHGFDVKG